MESAETKYQAEPWCKLSSWEQHARAEIKLWITDEAYQKQITDNTMKEEFMGPFTKFLYHFASKCECGWGVMIDFNERSQRVFLPDHYYKWMHRLRDKIIAEIEAAESKPALT